MTEHDAYTAAENMLAAGGTATQEYAVTKGMLEAMVDEFGLDVVTSSLADVCEDKASHLQEAWQDDNAARAWTAAARALTVCAFDIRVTNVSIGSVRRAGR